MFGYIILSAVATAVVVLLGLAIFVGGSIIITRMDSDNAAEIITAMGKSFPLKSIWSRRK